MKHKKLLVLQIGIIVTHVTFINSSSTQNSQTPEQTAQESENTVSQAHTPLTSGYGSTHFIVGQAPNERKTHITQNIPENKTTQSNVYFSPDGNVRNALLNLIAQEKEKISIAVFVFTDKQIADALVNAHKRGVVIEIITDPVGIKDKYNKIGSLSDAGIHVMIYNAHNTKKNGPSVMHHKFAVFERNNKNKSCLWTGSCNFTKSACDSNQENAIIVHEINIVQKFTEQFKHLKKDAYKYTKI